MKIQGLGISIVFYLFFYLSITSYAQQKVDKIYLSAMKDEMQRSMDSLQEKDQLKPFFMAYALSRNVVTSVHSSLGAEFYASQRPNTQTNWRLMIGSYHINDENFNNSYNYGGSRRTYSSAVEIPYGADYWGIRRYFWMKSNNTYNSASNNYNQKVGFLKKHDLKYPLSDFSKDVPVINKMIADSLELLELNMVKDYTNRVSAHMLNYPNVKNSSVNFSHFQQYNYFVNSEGTTVGTPQQISLLNVKIQGMKSMFQSKMLTYLSKHSTDQIPADQIKADIDLLMQDTTLFNNTDQGLEDGYEGVVLLEGQAAADFFIANIFGESNMIVGDRRSITNNESFSYEKYLKGMSSEKEELTSKQLMSKHITIKDKPFMTEWEGKELIGSYVIDAEGVIPEKELTLVEHGKLVNQLNSRIPTLISQKPNGHYRLSVGSDYLARRQIAPGVLHVQFDNAISKSQLLQKFIAMINEDEMEYGIRINALDVSASRKPLKSYKYYVKTGKEESFHSSKLRFYQSKGLKKIVAVSQETVAFNFLYNGVGSYLADAFLGGSEGSNNYGVPASIIVPAAILVKNYTIADTEDRRESYYIDEEELSKLPIKGPLEKVDNKIEKAD